MLTLNTVMIGSDDPKSLREFYTKVLGKPAWEDNAYVGWQAGSSWLMIGEHSEVKGRNEMPGRIILNFETPDVKGEFGRIKGPGCRCSTRAVPARGRRRSAPGRGGLVRPERAAAHVERSVRLHGSQFWQSGPMLEADQPVPRLRDRSDCGPGLRDTH
jgi:hypothetical protein